MTKERAGAELAADLERRADATPAFRGRRLMLLPADKGEFVCPRRARHGAQSAARAHGARAGACVRQCCEPARRALGRERKRDRRQARARARDAPPSSGSFSPRRWCWRRSAARPDCSSRHGLPACSWRRNPDVLDIDTHVDMRVFLFGLSAAVLTASSPAGARAHIEQNPDRAGLRAAGRIYARHAPAPDTARPDRDVPDSGLRHADRRRLVRPESRNLRSIDPGFRADNLLLIWLTAGAVRCGSAGNLRRDATDRPFDRSMAFRACPSLERCPWRRAGNASRFTTRLRVRLPRSTPITSALITSARWNSVMGGREFSEQDATTSRRVVIVNERLAQMLWPAQDAVGKGVRIGSRNNPLSEVVAVVKDAKYRELRDEAVPMLYVPLLQITSSDVMTLHIRTAGNPMELIGPIRHEMRGLDSSLPLASRRRSTID